MSEKFTCPVCGFIGLDEKPPLIEEDYSTWEICPCCFVEFGCDAFWDNYDELRAQWIKEGMPWGSRFTQPPEGWDGIKQLGEAGFLSERK